MIAIATALWLLLLYCYIRPVQWTSEHVRHDVLVAMRGRK